LYDYRMRNIDTVLRLVSVAVFTCCLPACAREHIKTEKALAEAGFTPLRGTPEVAARLSEYTPYTFLASEERGKKTHYFASPARKTIYTGDDAALSRYALIKEYQRYQAVVRAHERRIQIARIGTALAAGGQAMGANMQQQAAMQQQYAMQQQAMLQQNMMMQQAAWPSQPIYTAPSYQAPINRNVYQTIPGTTMRDYTKISPIGVVGGN